MEDSSPKWLDSFGRVHDYLRISITEHCNLRCTYCMPAEGIHLTPKANLMTASEIVAIAKVFVTRGVKKIRLTGGEPLVRKDAKEIIERLSKLNVSLHLTTNGLLVHEYLDCFRVAGISSLNISIDTLDKDKFLEITRRNQFELLWENIELLRKNGFNIRLNVVLIKGFNDNEIFDFIQLTKAWDLQIRFIEFMPFDGNAWDKSKLVTYHEVLNAAYLNYGPEQVLRINDKPNDTAKNHKIRGFRGSFSVISTVSNPFCDTCNRIRLTADGKLKNCLFSDSETDLLTTLREGGHIETLIEENISAKFAVRAGMADDMSFQDPESFSKNRSMIKIGG